MLRRQRIRVLLFFLGRLSINESIPETFVSSDILLPLSQENVIPITKVTAANYTENVNAQEQLSTQVNMSHNYNVNNLFLWFDIFSYFNRIGFMKNVTY